MSNSRHNNSTRANIFIGDLFAEGAFKYVYEGRYVRGKRAGERCVAKQFKADLDDQEEAYFREEMHIMRTTQRIVDEWNDAGIITNMRVLLNRPEIWVDDMGGRRLLIEPMIENFEKFNSNTGWVLAEGIWSESMQALSHFSFHNSGGEVLLCDIQGGSYRDGFILTDPVIISQRERTYGPTDTGPEGIYTFFQNHICGRFCRPYWAKPPGMEHAPTMRARRGTAMARLPTRVTRNALTQVGAPRIPARRGTAMADPRLNTGRRPGGRRPSNGPAHNLLAWLL